MSFGSRRLPPPTADEKRRQEAARASGCTACHVLGLPKDQHCGPIEYHHRLHSGLTVGHRWGYALGLWHHQGQVKRGYSHEEMRAKYGTNLADDKGGFHARFGTDQALQNDQDDRVGYPRAEMPSIREQRLNIGAWPSRRKPSKCTASPKNFPRGCLA